MGQRIDPDFKVLLERSLRLIPPSIISDLISASEEKRDRALRLAADIISQNICDSKSPWWTISCRRGPARKMPNLRMLQGAKFSGKWPSRLKSQYSAALGSGAIVGSIRPSAAPR